MTNRIVVGIAEMALSSEHQDILVTYSLGSCLGVTIYDPDAKIGGMIHCMLPVSGVDPQKAEKSPSMFVDTGITKLLNEIYCAGAKKERIIVKAAGCAQLLDPKGLFKIGERNFTVLRKLLWKNGILLKSNVIGGSVSRTMILEIGSGKTFVKSQGEEVEI